MSDEQQRPWTPFGYSLDTARRVAEAARAIAETLDELDAISGSAPSARDVKIASLMSKASAGATALDDAVRGLRDEVRSAVASMRPATTHAATLELAKRIADAHAAMREVQR